LNIEFLLAVSFGFGVASFFHLGDANFKHSAGRSRERGDYPFATYA
jgi:hypothetical protein